MAVSISRPLKPLSNTLRFACFFKFDRNKSVIEGFFVLVLPCGSSADMVTGVYGDCMHNHMNVYLAQNGALSISAHHLISLTIATHAMAVQPVPPWVLGKHQCVSGSRVGPGNGHYFRFVKTNSLLLLLGEVTLSLASNSIQLYTRLRLRPITTLLFRQTI